MTGAPATLGRGDLLPEIRVAPPGPESRALSARLAAAEAPGANTLGPGDAPAIVWRAALGANVLELTRRHPGFARHVGRRAAEP